MDPQVATESNNPIVGEVDETLYPIAVLIDELKHDDSALRLNAIRRVSTIALALGPERTRDELIPYLDENIEDEDEILAILAEELGCFVEYVGGPEYAHLILNPLENLAAVEETVVRTKAVESLNIVAKSLSQAQAEEHLIPLIKRLANANWFTSRSSSTGVFAVAYNNVGPTFQTELIQLYQKLCEDETPMVRRSAGTDLTNFVKAVGKDHMNELLAMFNRLSGDDQDSVRLLMVVPLITLASSMEPEQVSEHLLENIKNLCNDASWRVRYMVAENFVDLGNATGTKIFKDLLLETYLAFIRDNEAEVRTSSIGQLPGYVKLVNQDTIKNLLLPILHTLAVDPSQHVRSALASNVSSLAPVLTKEATIELLLPLFLRLLKDEFPDVRLNIISRLEQVNQIIGVDLLSQSLLPAIVELAEDKQWRIRLAIIEYIPLLASQLGVDFFDAQLSDLCFTWLGDSVFAIRDAATVNLRKLIEAFGVEWASRNILPKILSMSTHSNYLYRMTTLFTITTIAPALSADVVKQDVLPVIVTMAQDPIPNIRFNTAKALKVLADVLVKAADGNVNVTGENIKPTLQKLTEDSDADVKFFAGEALLQVS